MEIVYTTDFNNKFSEDKINLFYGDIIDLNSLGIKCYGIVYDDDKKVKRFLGNNKRTSSILSYLDVDDDILNKKIKDLSKTDFKWMLLAYMLINNYKYIIFDYFDLGLTYKDKKQLIKVIRQMNKDGYHIIVISKDLIFMNSLNDYMYMGIDKNVCLEGNMIDLILDNQRLFELPEIIKFINMANKKGASLDYTLDSKELIKDIYRGVK